MVSHLMNRPADDPPPCLGFDHTEPSKLVVSRLLPRAEQLVRDHERADRVVAAPAAGVADHVRVTLGEAGKLRRIEPRVHAGQHREAPRRRHRETALVAERLAVAGVGVKHLLDEGRTGKIAQLTIPKL